MVHVADRASVGLVVATASVILVACATGGSGTSSTPTGGAPAGCPIVEAEVEAALGVSMEPVSVGQPYKNVTQDCSFGFGPLTTASIQFLVFDTEGAGLHFWDDARPDYPDLVDVAGVGDAAFVTGSPRAGDLFAVKGDVGLHVYVFEHDPLTVDQLSALARAALARL